MDSGFSAPEKVSKERREGVRDDAAPAPERTAFTRRADLVVTVGAAILGYRPDSCKHDKRKEFHCWWLWGGAERGEEV